MFQNSKNRNTLDYVILKENVFFTKCRPVAVNNSKLSLIFDIIIFSTICQ